MGNGADSVEVQLTRLFERLGAVSRELEAAHRRTDRIEGEFKKTIDQIRDDIAAMRKDMRPIIAFQNQAVGAKAMAMTLAGLVGGVLVWAADRVMRGG